VGDWLRCELLRFFETFLSLATFVEPGALVFQVSRLVS
jgi:hypothetical protein